MQKLTTLENQSFVLLMPRIQIIYHHRVNFAVPQHSRSKVCKKYSFLCFILIKLSLILYWACGKFKWKHYFSPLVLPSLHSPHPRVTTELGKLTDIQTTGKQHSNLQGILLQVCFKLSLKVPGSLLLCQEESTEILAEAKECFAP